MSGFIASFNTKAVKLLFLLLIVLGGVIALGFFFKFEVAGYDKVKFYAKYHSQIQTIKKLRNVFTSFRMIAPSKLERYDLIVKTDDLAFLESNLPAGYENNFLRDIHKQPVAAEFVSDGKKYDVSVRFRGDTDIHWRDPKKSWRIDFDELEGFNGLRKMHLVIPFDRFYLLEELSFYRARKAGLAVPETKFVNLFVNGKRQGVYWQVEHWTEEFLVKNKISNKADLYGSGEFGDLSGSNLPPIETFASWKKYTNRSPDGVDDFSNLQPLLNIFNKSNLAREEISSTVNLNNFYNWQINQLLVSSAHQADRNLRLYHDPETNLINFIPWDVSIGNISGQYDEPNSNTLVTKVLNVPEFLHERNLRLWEYLSDSGNLDDDLTHYDSLDKLTRNDFYKDSKKVANNFNYRKSIKDIRNRIKIISDNLLIKLRYATADVKIDTETYSNTATVLISTRGFSSISLETLSLNIGECMPGISVYQDINANNYFDLADRIIDQYSCSEGVYQFVLDEIIYSVKDDAGSILKTGENNLSLFIKTDQPVKTLISSPDQIGLFVNNAVTGEPLENAPVIINSNQ